MPDTTPTAADELRDRITTAISRWHRDPEMPLYEQGADAVLAVLREPLARQVLGTPTTDPAPASDRMPCSLATLHRPHPPHTWEPQPGMTPLGCPGAPASAPAAPADRATVLREAAEELDAWEPDLPERWTEPERNRYEDGVDGAVDRLRRLADEAQPTETDGDPICGDQYDDEACELEPEHAGAHCAGIVCWDYGRAPATAATEEPQP